MAWLAACLVIACPSCGLFSGLTRAKSDPAAASTQMSLDVMRLADTVIIDTGRAAGRLSAEVGTPEAHYQATSWSVRTSDRVLSIATDANPVQATVDLLFYVTVQRTLHEQYWMPEVYHEADRPMVEAYQHAEELCWAEIATVLDEKQRAGLKTMIGEWKEQNPDLRAASTLEAPSFADFVVRTKSKGGPSAAEFFDLLTFDPMAGLEPAVREVAVTRQLGERVFFFARHLPRLMSQHVDLTTLKTARLPEVQSGLQQTERISLACEKLKELAETLPETVRAEREKTLQQISAELTAQREGLVANLKEAEAPLRSVLGQTQQTMEEGRRMSDSIANLIGTAQSSVPHDDSMGASLLPSASAKPFDIRAYGETAASIGDAARELTTAVTTIDHEFPHAESALDAAKSRLDLSIDHAYSRALELVLWTVAALVLGIAVLRAVWSRLARSSISA